MYELNDNTCIGAQRGFEGIFRYGEKNGYNISWYRDIWRIMNDVKPLPLIPGLNMVTVYQLAEYFEVPVKHIKNIEKRYHIEDTFGRRLVRGDEMGFLALNKKNVVFEGNNHIQYDFKGFSIHIAAAGTICYSPYVATDFLPYIKDSEVCSAIICKMIKQFDYENAFRLNLDMKNWFVRLRKSVEKYEQNEFFRKEQAIKEAEAKSLLLKAIEDLHIDISVLATINFSE